MYACIHVALAIALANTIAQSQTITPTNPHDGDYLITGQPIQLTWDSTSDVTYIGLSLLHPPFDSAYLLICDNVPNTGSYWWTPMKGRDHDETQLRFVGYGMGFNIMTPIIVHFRDPSVTFFVPQDGAHLTAGTTQEIVWAYTTGMGAISISLWTSEPAFSSMILSATPATIGSFMWSIPSTISTGTYTLRVQDDARTAPMSSITVNIAGVMTASCTLQLPFGVNWGNCAATVADGTICAFTCAVGTFATTGQCANGQWSPSPQCPAGCLVDADCSGGAPHTERICFNGGSTPTPANPGNCGTGCRVADDCPLETPYCISYACKSLSRGELVVYYAQSMVGKYPYSWGGGNDYGPTTGIVQEIPPYCNDVDVVGFDCSGLAKYAVYQGTGETIRRNAQDQYTYGYSKISVDSRQPGDLIFYGASTNNIYHVAIYAGQNQMIEASGHNPDCTGILVRQTTLRTSNLVGVARYWGGGGTTDAALCIAPSLLVYMMIAML